MFIILITLLPGSVVPRMPVFLDLFQPDKIIHLFVFGAYVFMQIRGIILQPAYPSLRKHAVIFALATGISLSAVTELLQHYCIPLRTASVYDFAANVAGCLIGWWVAAKNHSRD